MSRLYMVSQAGFEAACQLDGIFPPGHAAAGLHGHGYVCQARVPQAVSGLDDLEQKLAHIASTLDYCFLNDMIDTPTDENIARYILSRLELADIDKVGVYSTHHSGVDLDLTANAHIWRRYRFEAAHQLPNVPAGHQCGRMHGHGFEVILHVNQGIAHQHMGIDFDHLDLLWKPLQQQLDGHCLNHITGLENPTSEVISAWIWQQLKPQLPQLSWVTVYETHTSGCHYNGRHYRIWKEQYFESAIIQQEQLTGHSYKIRLHLQAELDTVMGWTVDYGDVKRLFQPVYRQLDHQRLDQLNGLASPKLEQIVQWIYQQIGSCLPQLDRIDLFERPGIGVQLCCAEEGPGLPD